METERVCKVCQKTLPIEAFALKAQWRKRTCIACSQAWQKAYDLARSEERKIYYVENKERFAHKSREWYKANRERRLETSKRWVQENADRVDQNQKAWRSRNRDKVNAASRKWRSTERSAAIRAAWRITNRDKRREASKASQARRRAAAGSVTPDKILARWDQFGGLCWICAQPATCMDHVKPLAKGGSNWSSNLRPACKRCNSRKAAKWLGVDNLANLATMVLDSFS